jgi:hypothetical protein
VNLINKLALKGFIFNKIYLFIFSLIIILLFFIYYINEKYSICILINLTHIPCPFCGISRAFSNLLHLKILAAIKYNLLIILYAPILFGIIIIQILPKKIRIKLYFFLLDKIKLLNMLFITIIIISLVFGIVRIFDHFFHFINFKEVIPEKTILKYFKEIKIQI